MLSLRTKMETVTDDVLDDMHKSIENLEKTKFELAITCATWKVCLQGATMLVRFWVI